MEMHLQLIGVYTAIFKTKPVFSEHKFYFQVDVSAVTPQGLLIPGVFWESEHFHALAAHR